MQSNITRRSLLAGAVAIVPTAGIMQNASAAALMTGMDAMPDGNTFNSQISIPTDGAAPSAEIIGLVDAYKAAREAQAVAFDVAAETIPYDELSCEESNRRYDEITNPPSFARWGSHDAIRAFKPDNWADFAAKAMGLAGEADVAECNDPPAEILFSLLEDIHRMTGMMPSGDRPTGRYSIENWWPQGGAS